MINPLADRLILAGAGAVLIALCWPERGAFWSCRRMARMSDRLLIEVARQHDLQLYCGEFGAFPTTDVEMRQRLYTDMREIFDRNGIAWAHWNYKDDFPLVTEDLEPITELVEALLPPGAVE